MKIAVTCRQMQRDLDQVLPLLDQLGFEVACPPVVQELAGDELVAALDGAVGVIAGDDKFTSDVLDRLPELRVISKWGVGVDAIDRAAAAARGIVVTNTPGAFDDEVADVALGYLLMLARQLHEIDRGVRNGGWPKPVGTSLAGSSVAVVGLGGIGRAFGRRARALGMEVSGSDPSPVSRRLAEAEGVRMGPFDEVIAGADFVSFHCPLTPETHHLLDGRAFGLMRRGVRIINTARGPVIDESALIAALHEGIVGGAALDVFEDEPLPPSSPLRRYGSVVFGSHNASNTRQASARTHIRALENLVKALGMGMPA